MGKEQGLWALARVSHALEKMARASILDVARWQWWFQIKLTAWALGLGVALVPVAQHGHLWRFWVDSALMKQLLADALQERVLHAHEPESSHAQPSLTSEMVQARCFIPAGADLSGMDGTLNKASIAEAQAWVHDWLHGESWWVLDASRGDITRLSRMDETLLRPHPRMNHVQCFPKNAMRFINAGVNERGEREFQVLAHSQPDAPR